MMVMEIKWYEGPNGSLFISTTIHNPEIRNPNSEYRIPKCKIRSNAKYAFVGRALKFAFSKYEYHTTKAANNKLKMFNACVAVYQNEYIYIYWLTKETLQTFCTNGSSRKVALGYLLYSNKWIIATMLLASSIIVVCDWRFMRWLHLLKQHLMPLRLITWPILMQNSFHTFFHESW